MKRTIYDTFASISLWGVVVTITLGLFYPFIVLAEEVEEVIEVAPVMPDTGQFFEAIANQHWPLAVAIAVMFLVWIFRSIVKNRLPTSLVPYFVLGATVLSGAAARVVQFSNSDQLWWHGLIQGVLEGAMIGWTSMGMHSTGGKKLPKRE